MKIVACLSFILLLGSFCSSKAVTNKVLIIGVDGTRNDSLAVAHTPNLDALKSNGCYSVRAVTHPVTHSAACWSSMFTGVWGDKHLVNDPNNSFTGNQFNLYPSFFKRLEAFNSNLNTVCLARWAPLLTVVPDADAKLSFGSDDAITAETCRRLTNTNPDVLYMILLDVDSAGHTYGWSPAVINYVREIEKADVRVGLIMQALALRATYTNENWLVIVLTDHGEHDNPDPEKSRITWHIVSGPSAAHGVMWPSPAIVDICATVLTHIGVPIDPAWNLDARIEGMPLRPVTYGTNLLFNGSAEANSSVGNYNTNRAIAWWFDISSTSIGSYGGNAAFPSAVAPGPMDRGSNFFLGGTANGNISQKIALSEVAGDIDNGVDFTLSGWFGGASAEEDFACLTANFLGAAANILGSAAIGNVSAGERSGVTGLLERSTNGVLPSGTRFVEFVLTNQVVSGVNDSTADNLSFVLALRQPDSPFPLTLGKTTRGECRVEFTTLSQRVYFLERSENLGSWVQLEPSVAGSGRTESLIDTNPPPGGAYYRVRCARP